MGSKHPADSDTGILKPSAAVCPAPRAGVGTAGRRAVPAALRGVRRGWRGFSSAFFMFGCSLSLL